MSNLFCIGAPMVPTLSNAIRNIVEVRTHEQVIGANASAIIAVVTDIQAVRDGAVMQLVGEAMSGLRASIETKLTVSAYSATRRPHPTGAEVGAMFRSGAILIDLAPKPILWRLSRSGVPTCARAVLVRLLRVMQKGLATYKASTFCFSNFWPAGRLAWYTLHGIISLTDSVRSGAVSSSARTFRVSIIPRMEAARV